MCKYKFHVIPQYTVNKTNPNLRFKEISYQKKFFVKYILINVKKIVTEDQLLMRTGA
jgi:hypothetical protein